MAFICELSEKDQHIKRTQKMPEGWCFCGRGNLCRMFGSGHRRVLRRPRRSKSLRNSNFFGPPRDCCGYERDDAR